MNEEIMVSINCETYNHQCYITDAIEGFLMQKTAFPFEILIHDDASTDKTPDIIKRYQVKFPHLINPIYQTENQYSKGVQVERINEARAKGKYIAYCEGDDYWIDPYKLQKQVDYMQVHPECSMCVHTAYRVLPNKTKRLTHVRPSSKNRIFTTEDVIRGGGGLFATNSIMYPAKFKTYRPNFYTNAPVGDYPLAIYLALQGTVYYMDEFMSAYRVGVQGSWTSKVQSNNKKRKEICTKVTSMLNEVDVYTKRQFKHTIKYTQKKEIFLCLIACNRLDEVSKADYKEFRADLSFKTRIKIGLKLYFPTLANTLIKIRKKLRL